MRTGQPFVGNMSQLLATGPDHSLASANVLPAGAFWWSGSDIGGIGVGVNCDDWVQSGSSCIYGIYGNADFTDYQWIDYRLGACNRRKYQVCLCTGGTPLSTATPTKSPSGSPTPPTGAPTRSPHSSRPSKSPSRKPSASPSGRPTNRPTTHPTGKPTNVPTNLPTNIPTYIPTHPPTHNPTKQPTFARPIRIYEYSIGNIGLGANSVSCSSPSASQAATYQSTSFPGATGSACTQSAVFISTSTNQMKNIPGSPSMPSAPSSAPVRGPGPNYYEIATSWSNFMSGFTYTLEMTISAAGVTGGPDFWSGSDNNGNDGFDCSGWSTFSPAVSGYQGSTALSTDYLDNGAVSCNSFSTVLCVCY